MEEQVILVDEQDREIGLLEKLEAHRLGLLHRAFSVFIFNSKGELLLQQRALDKYHSPGLWTNTCCSHPRSGESVLEAANRRLKEEMGLTTSLQPLFQFVYHAEFNNGLIEHEYDHVLIGFSEELPQPNPAEVATTRYISWSELLQDVQQHPDMYTAWLCICMDRYNHCFPISYER